MLVRLWPEAWLPVKARSRIYPRAGRDAQQSGLSAPAPLHRRRLGHQKDHARQAGQTRQQYAITPVGQRELIRRLSNFGESEAASWPGFITRVGMFEALEEPVRASILFSSDKLPAEPRGEADHPAEKHGSWNVRRRSCSLPDRTDSLRTRVDPAPSSAGSEREIKSSQD